MLPRNLTPAPRRQDHTTSPYASCALVFCAIRIHRIPPRVRDDREPPLVTGETRGIKSVICPTTRVEYFCVKGWTDFWRFARRVDWSHPQPPHCHCERSEAIHRTARGD